MIIPTPLRRFRSIAFLALAALSMAQSAHGWVLNIAGGTRQLFLQVGNGTLNTNVATINLVSVTVPAAQLGNSTAQAMATNSTQANSPWDNYTVCTPTAGQVYAQISICLKIVERVEHAAPHPSNYRGAVLKSQHQ
jgi:hypothetical protein